VPVRSLLVLLRSKADHWGLNGHLTYSSGDKHVTFEYGVIRLWQEPAAAFLHGGIGLLPLATLCKMPSGKPTKQSLQDVANEIDRRLAELPDHAQAVRIMSAAFTLMAIRVPRESLSNIFAGVKIMHKMTWLDEIEEAQIKSNKRSLLSIGRQKFGEPERKDENALNRIKELARLERMIDAILEAKSWKELLAIR
jgi:hypothetical protein